MADGSATGLTGTTTSQHGAVRLPGVAVVVLDRQGREAARTQSDGEGRYTVEVASAGRYAVVAKLEGFRDARREIDLEAGVTAEVDLDLDVAVSEVVSVVARPADTKLTIASKLAPREVVASPVAEQLPAGDDSIQAALRLMSSVTAQTGGVRIKGGRADQASLQVGSVIVNDPTGGSGALHLPVDAADSVEVLPNPYSVEFGGFASGLTIVHPASASDAWRARFNGFEPSFITKRNNPFDPVALESLEPRVVAGGPIAAGRLTLLQSAQYRYGSEEVWSRPQSERRGTEGASVFTKLDGRAGARHTISAMLGLFPTRTTNADLDTFTPPAAAIDLNELAAVAAFTDSAQLPASAALESTVAVSRFSSQSLPRGLAPMTVTPDQVLGNFYNGQDRSAVTVQWSEAFSAARTGWFGTHVFKAGLEMLHTGYAATSTSRTIDVRREDGTLAERLTFDPASRWRVGATDGALFAQDRWQPHPRALVELGGRFQRDGVLGDSSFAPRAGGTLAIKADGSIALRAGIGVFTERTPPAVQAFGLLEGQTEARYAADGITLLAPPVHFVHALAPDLRTPRSLTWNVEYDQRVTPRLSVRVNYLDRHGSNELIVQPVQSGAIGALLLSSGGRSEYRDAEFAVHYVREHAVEITASYTRSLSMADLNAYSVFYGLKQDPFVRADEYAPTDVNAPNRLLLWTTIDAVPKWLFGIVGEVRNGFPYSPVNEYLDYVGPRNQGRTFPAYVSLDVSVERRIRVGRLAPWIGFRLYNALDSFTPIDVQANLGSPAFGTFYNSTPRQFRISLRFAR